MSDENVDWDRLLEQLDAHEMGEGWVSLTEAAGAAGVSLSTLRSWYRTGQIRSGMVGGVHGPERRVFLEDVIDRSLRSKRLSRQLDQARSREDRIEDLARRVAAIEARLGLTPAGD
ncbi:MAG TPA: hypothetical protein VGR90_03725 [Acidimicrobiales bacterium]|nr:hypothetical protein [Acidimicrobiales bacterium]